MELEWTSISEESLTENPNADNLFTDALNSAFAVADGVGGTPRGILASKIAIEQFQNTITQGLPNTENITIENILKTGFEKTNNLLYQKGLKLGNSTCSTLTAVIIYNNTLYLAHSGDSRAYLVTPDPESVKQLTDDHTLVADMVREGLMDEHQASIHPRRNILTSCLGLYSRLRIQTTSFPLSSGQVIILCTDGVSSYISENDIIECTRSVHSVKEIAKCLTKTARINGSIDDMSAIIIRLY
jgi:protein phosphatase